MVEEVGMARSLALSRVNVHLNVVPGQTEDESRYVCMHRRDAAYLEHFHDAQCK